MARKLRNQFTVYAIISNNEERENNFYFFLFFFIKKVSEIIDHHEISEKSKYKFFFNPYFFTCQNQTMILQELCLITDQLYYSCEMVQFHGIYL